LAHAEHRDRFFGFGRDKGHPPRPINRPRARRLWRGFLKPLVFATVFVAGYFFMRIDPMVRMLPSIKAASGFSTFCAFMDLVCRCMFHSHR
jgi:hypothetical protein